ARSAVERTATAGEDGVQRVLLGSFNDSPVAPSGRGSLPAGVPPRKSFRSESAGPEKIDPVPGGALHRQVGEDLPDHAAELESVAAEATAEDHPRLPGREVDQEMLVWRVGEHADLHGQRPPGPLRQV